MSKVTLGKTGITVDKNGFGALPIQRVTFDEAKKLLRKAYEGGITFFDTARSYTDSEEKIGYSLSDVRSHLYLASKTPAKNAEGFWKDLETGLKLMKTDYIDLYQFHNPDFCPKPGDGTGLYEAALEAKKQGKIRFIGITNHRLHVAKEAIISGLYDTLQFPFCYLATEKDLEIVNLCKEREIGFIAMKALSGGLITNARAAAAFLGQYDHVLPIWGVQRECELDEFLQFVKEPPVMDEEIAALIAKEKQELSGNFCRGCGYCLPCPAQIEIPMSARMSLLLRRMPSAPYLAEEWQAKMERIENCIHCNHCSDHCPYGLDTPALLRENLEDYRTFLK
ncbi:aldo/keto reductase [Zongyangia hominis]|uniref:Aldo/keto reductase n=1 Tax=Zongyangia hominis TaxID=2763677 RepID=A0A926E8X6_9FIRM|nr:aldo/keto reductase [Zongyangia hominis]MBC8569497.1 aldo/keto reductase [Zongyangia hominis]